MCGYGNQDDIYEINYLEPGSEYLPGRRNRNGKYLAMLVIKLLCGVQELSLYANMYDVSDMKI